MIRDNKLLGSNRRRWGVCSMRSSCVLLHGYYDNLCVCCPIKSPHAAPQRRAWLFSLLHVSYQTKHIRRPNVSSRPYRERWKISQTYENIFLSYPNRVCFSFSTNIYCAVLYAFKFSEVYQLITRRQGVWVWLRNVHISPLEIKRIVRPVRNSDYNKPTTFRRFAAGYVSSC